MLSRAPPYDRSLKLSAGAALGCLSAQIRIWANWRTVGITPCRYGCLKVGAYGSDRDHIRADRVPELGCGPLTSVAPALNCRPAASAVAATTAVPARRAHRRAKDNWLILLQFCRSTTARDTTL